MITLVLISSVALGVLLYRPLHSLFRQIPRKNGDFNAFMSPADVERQSLGWING